MGITMDDEITTFGLHVSQCREKLWFINHLDVLWFSVIIITKRIMIARNDIYGYGMMRDENASRPHRLSICYAIYADKGSSEIVKKGALAVTLDLDRKNENIYEMAYSELKTTEPSLSTATDDK